MVALIIIFKILTALIAAYRIYKLYTFFRSDKNVRFSFDLLSMLEVDAVIGLTIIALLAKIDETAYAFTLVLCILAAVLNAAHLFRIIIAGDKRIMIGNNSFDFKELKGMNASRVTLHVYEKNGKRHDVLVPLTRNDVISRMDYIK